MVAGVFAASPAAAFEGAFTGSGLAASGATDPFVTLTCATGPLSPGLSMRTLTLMFVDPGAGAGDWVGVTEGADGCGCVVAAGVSVAVSAVVGVISLEGAGCEATSGVWPVSCVAVSPAGTVGDGSADVGSGASTTGAASSPGTTPTSGAAVDVSVAPTASVAAVVAASASDATEGSCVGSPSSARAVEGATTATAVRRETAAVQTTAGRSRCRRISKSSMRFVCDFHSRIPQRHYSQRPDSDVECDVKVGVEQV